MRIFLAIAIPIWLVVDSVALLSRNNLPEPNQAYTLMTIGKVISVQTSFFLARLEAGKEVHLGQPIYLVSVQKGDWLQMRGESTIQTISQNPLFGKVIRANLHISQSINRGVKEGDRIAIAAESDFPILRKELAAIENVATPTEAIQLYGRILAVDPSLVEAHYGQLKRMLQSRSIDRRLIAKKYADTYARRNNFFDASAAKSFYRSHYNYLTTQAARNTKDLPRIINVLIESAEASRVAFPSEKDFLTHVFSAHWLRIRRAATVARKSVAPSRVPAPATRASQIPETVNFRKQRDESIQTSRQLLAYMLENDLYTDNSLKIATEFIIYLHNRLRGDVRQDLQRRRDYRLFIRENILPRIAAKNLSNRISRKLQQLPD